MQPLLAFRLFLLHPIGYHLRGTSSLSESVKQHLKIFESFPEICETDSGSSQSILNPYARATGRVEARLRGDDSSQLDGYWMPGSRRLRLGFIEAVFEAARLHASELMRTRTENPCISKSYAVHRTVTEDLGNSSKAGLHRRLPYQYGHKMLV